MKLEDQYVVVWTSGEGQAVSQDLFIFDSEEEARSTMGPYPEEDMTPVLYRLVKWPQEE